MVDSSRLARDEKELDTLLQTLKQYQSTISETKIYHETVDGLSTLSPKCLKITHIRCLALGSPSESKPALFQLAYLLEVQHHLSVPSENVSLFDPVFNARDTDFLTKHCQLKVEQGYKVKADINEVLFFLPHAGLELTEEIISENHPRWILGNYLISHTDRLSKQKLFDNYKNLAHLVKLFEDASTSTGVVAPPGKPNDDGFTNVSNRKSRNDKRKKNKYVFTEPLLDYNFTNTYYENVECKKIAQQEGTWGNAFTDLACHYIVPKQAHANNTSHDEAVKQNEGETPEDLTQKLENLTVNDA